MMIALPKGVLESVANYLANRPFREVAHILAAVEQHCIAVEEDEDGNYKRLVGQRDDSSGTELREGDRTVGERNSGGKDNGTSGE